VWNLYSQKLQRTAAWKPVRARKGYYANIVSWLSFDSPEADRNVTTSQR